MIFKVSILGVESHLPFHACLFHGCKNGPISQCLDLDLNGKRPGIASDGNFSSFLIDRSWYNHFPVIFYERKWRAALTGQANPANQPISDKIAKMALFNPCMEFKKFLGQMTSFEVLRKCHFMILSKMCLRLRPCAYLGG